MASFKKNDVISVASLHSIKMQVYLYINDNDAEKIEFLNTRIPKHIGISPEMTEVMDANELLRKSGSQFPAQFKNMHFLLIHDLYDVHIERE